MVKQSEEQILDTIIKNYEGRKIYLLAPIVKGRKGHYREEFAHYLKLGFTKVRLDGELKDITPKMQADRYKTHDIDVVVDRLEVKEHDRLRISQSIALAMKIGKGVVSLLDEKEKLQHFSKFLMDPISGISYDEPAPNLFSFNSPYGACSTCNGLGIVQEISEEAVIPNKKLSISQGAIAPLGTYRDVWIFHKLDALLKSLGFNISTPVKDLPEEVLKAIFYGSDELMEIQSEKYKKSYVVQFEGIINFLERWQEYGSEKTQDWIGEYTTSKICPDCNGMRLKKESLHFKVDGKNISELAKMDIAKLSEWFEGLEDRLDHRQRVIATEVMKEVRKRMGFLTNIGLGYLSLDRPMQTLSGGEAQRIRLATQIGSQLVNVLYILDEPSIGLHQRDNVKLIKALQNLRNNGNSVIVVEHDRDMMLEADYVVDIGPGAGRHGGQIVAQGHPKDILKSESLTASYLNGFSTIQVPEKRRKGTGKKLVLKGAKGNNLKNVKLELPLGKLVCVTGVSGSGKSTLIHDTLVPILFRHCYKSKREPLPYEKIDGLAEVDKVIEVDQSPIGRTPRSNPATYTGVFSDIRNLFAQLPEAKIRGYKPGRFSFNVKGGRCETCEGGGRKVVEMEFLPDVTVECETCKGKRYNRETLEVRFKGKSIADVLDMTVEQAVEFFASQPSIVRKIQTLNEVGLGYISLGQHATTLSGGEAQRVKLATELSKRDTGKTVYILDEPTTGLHFSDIQHLLDVVNKLVDKGNTVIVIEHNLDVIKVADHVIDMGPDGGSDGGEILTSGTPEEVAKFKGGFTAAFLREELNNQLT
jgi:excinuclease ABC subunit A